MYLLDTNIISAVARDPGCPVGQMLGSVDPDMVVTNSVVACEVQFGLAKNTGSRNATRSVLPVEAHISVEYAKTRTWFVQRGKSLGPNDLLIAAHALTIGATVVSDDRAFEIVPGLKVENWVRDRPAGRE